MKNKKYKILRTIGGFFTQGNIYDEKIILEWLTESGLNHLIKERWIEEIQEPEFTRNDLFDFGQYINHNTTLGTKYTDEGIDQLINSWIKWKKQ